MIAAWYGMPSRRSSRTYSARMRIRSETVKMQGAMKKIDFSNIQVTDIEGKKVPVDIRQMMGNLL